MSWLTLNRTSGAGFFISDEKEDVFPFVQFDTESPTLEADIEDYINKNEHILRMMDREFDRLHNDVTAAKKALAYLETQEAKAA